MAALVIATAGHEPPGGIDPDAASVVLDADLAILAAEPAAYSAYVAGVRAEYSHIDDAGWRAGRAAVLAELLRRSEIYRSPPMREREARAGQPDGRAGHPALRLTGARPRRQEMRAIA